MKRNVLCDAADFLENSDKKSKLKALEQFAEEAKCRAEGDTIYFFVYGSLMWKHPGLGSPVKRSSMLHGFRRDVALSTLYRGTPEQPGLVFGIKENDETSVEGMALGINKDKFDTAFEWYIYQELQGEDDLESGSDKCFGMYKLLLVELEDKHGNIFKAITVAIDGESPKATSHPLYSALHDEHGDMSVNQKALLIVLGQRCKYRFPLCETMQKLSDNGSALTYWNNSISLMHTHGMHDPYFEAIDAVVQKKANIYNLWLNQMSVMMGTYHNPLARQQEMAKLLELRKELLGGDESLGVINLHPFLKKERVEQQQADFDYYSTFIQQSMMGLKPDSDVISKATDEEIPLEAFRPKAGYFERYLNDHHSDSRG